MANDSTTDTETPTQDPEPTAPPVTEPVAEDGLPPIEYTEAWPDGIRFVGV